jgi:hypothetical protein
MSLPLAKFFLAEVRGAETHKSVSGLVNGSKLKQNICVSA